MNCTYIFVQSSRTVTYSFWLNKFIKLLSSTLCAFNLLRPRTQATLLFVSIPEFYLN
ncbi:hypothetical protein X975_18522, partial [Stegodyphus mimosarum]